MGCTAAATTPLRDLDAALYPYDSRIQLLRVMMISLTSAEHLTSEMSRDLLADEI